MDGNTFIEVKNKRKIINSVRFTVMAYCTPSHTSYILITKIPRQKIDFSPLVLVAAAFYHKQILSGFGTFSFTDLKLITYFSITYFPAVLHNIIYYTIINYCNYCLYTTLKYNAVDNYSAESP